MDQKVETTYRGSGTFRMDVFVTHVNVKFTRNLDEESDPLVDGVGRKIVLCGAHWVIAPCVLEHQLVPVLERLDPLGEPGKGQVLPGQPLLR
jgi:hypothetical protein